MGHYPHRLQNWHYSYRLHITTLQIDYCHTWARGYSSKWKFPSLCRKGFFFHLCIKFSTISWAYPPPKKKKTELFIFKQKCSEKNLLGTYFPPDFVIGLLLLINLQGILLSLNILTGFGKQLTPPSTPPPLLDDTPMQSPKFYPSPCMRLYYSLSNFVQACGRNAQVGKVYILYSCTKYTHSLCIL